MRSLKQRDWAVAAACWLAMGIGPLAHGQTGAEPSAQGVAQNVAQNHADAGKSADNGLVIEPAELPVTYPRGPYQLQLQGRGNFVPVLQWKVESGTLPPGIRLEDSGLLHGAAERAGEFQFVVSAKDGGQPRQAVQKGFVLKVMEAFTMTWKSPPHVAGNRIEGSVEVSNATPEDMDFTFDVKAVAENGRATEIGYQRFPLKHGTIGMALPFGESLPHGAYVVYVNGNGEVARRNAIYKQQLQTPAPLQVVVGP
jgi:hypothetical protein